MKLKKIDLEKNEYILIEYNEGGITYDRYNSDNTLKEHLGFTPFTDEAYWGVDKVFKNTEQKS
jgi:hypothetical protein